MREHQHTGKKLFPMGVMRPQHTLPERLRVPTPGVPRLDGALGNPLYGRCPCMWHGVGTRWSLRSLPAQTILRSTISAQRSFYPSGAPRGSKQRPAREQQWPCRTPGPPEPRHQADVFLSAIYWHHLRHPSVFTCTPPRLSEGPGKSKWPKPPSVTLSPGSPATQWGALAPGDGLVVPSSAWMGV